MKKQLQYLMTFELINVPKPLNTEYLFHTWFIIIDEEKENNPNGLKEVIIKEAINCVTNSQNINTTVLEENIKITGIYLLNTTVLEEKILTDSLQWVPIEKAVLKPNVQYALLFEKETRTGDWMPKMKQWHITGETISRSKSYFPKAVIELPKEL